MKLTRMLAPLFIGVLTLAGCSSADNTTSSSEAASTTVDGNNITVVASTQVWADVAKEVSPDIDATAIINGDETDPHSFEPTAADMAKAKAADIIVVGGGGYDAWLYTAVDQDKIIHALPLTTHDHDHGHDHGEEGHDHDHDHGEEGHDHDHDHGDKDHDHDHGAAESESAEAHEHEHGEEGHDHDHAHGEEGHHHDHDAEANEHIWYDIDAVDAVAEQIAQRVAELDPKATINAGAVADKLAPIHETLKDLPAITVAQTEPIADYIIEQTPMKEATPSGYRHATLNESEPSAADVAAFLKALDDGSIDLLIYNPQTATETTKKLREEAEKHNIPVVEISETPAKDQNFFTFYADEVDNLAAAAKALNK
ncbi:metal ABC transporter solute-binding protein, Zn/Mn family [Corynebacterium aquilae]|uniref:ABC transporter substrate-binding protein n=1 Tax=Corynebacterium aquilae DSM 44791 TaxID=1431546 RepID=A0A1L7CI19_9CORY|nr:zinc ABC transporter substrate-binding protein [Corynebacterium aquilae]APT85469.1 hypothetical protein CAQU_10870 [Corynebacterium aquilae DSM 44791]